MVLRRIFGSKRDEVTGEWRKLHNVELSELFSPIIVRVIKSRRMRWARCIACMGEKRGFGGKTGGKRPLGRPWWRWEKVELGSRTRLIWLGIGTGGDHLATR